MDLTAGVDMLRLRGAGPAVQHLREGTMAWDVFICHASEDKAAFVRDLAVELAKRGLQVWYDEMELRLGDSLRRKIDEGLRESRFGIVVLSPHFFGKNWTE